ncbi:putative regulator of Ras-like GTPase activity (Roadblock/LC7/MglB family) [Lysobacter ruishenii]|uniref:Putative regulator of Ras-like GTPase activity (Roadblock/LC7/MglB family) n=2 Tax=Aerolutibacter ruishenii TaxID=686800 RepID=A0A562LWJ5_9GAMM|nr:putative regulator of Ras-like GTPase activity (Roadblock/LC7/MglB family) [Lysobacter ruishenii]
MQLMDNRVGTTLEPDRSRCASALDHLVASDGILAAMLAMRDGRPFLMRNRNRRWEEGKMAAMVSSTVALGQTFLRELTAGPLDHILIEGTEGKLVICSVARSNSLLLLAVVAERDARLGMVLGHSKTCAQAVAEAFPGIVASGKGIA